MSIHPNVDLHTLPDSTPRDKHFAVFHVKHLRHPTLDLSSRVADGPRLSELFHVKHRGSL